MANLLDLSPDEFMFTLQEFGYSPDRRDELIRQYREHNSVFGALNRAAQERQAEIAGEGRRPVAGGFLSKPEGSLGMDAVRGLRVEPMAGLLGMLTGAGRAVEAPAAAYQGLIPMADVPLEALGTAGMASLGGAAMTRPAGSVGMGGRESDFGQGWQGAYHWTRSPEAFDQFNPDKSNSAMSQLGPHVGTRAAAESRAMGFQNQTGQMMELRADTRRPFLNPQTNEPWSEFDLEQFISAFADEHGVERRKAAPIMRRILANEGYTDIPYVNDVEDADSISNIMLVDRPRDADAVLRLNDAAFDPARRTDPNLLAANRDQTVGLLSTAAAAEPRNAAERMARDILDMRAAGRAGEVTDAMMAQADPQYMFANTPLPMDEASRMVRAGAAGFDTGVPLYHGTGADFQAFDTARFQQSDFGTGGAGVYSSESPGLAGAYADLVTRPSNDNANILPIVTRRQEAYDTGGYRNINNDEQAREYSQRMQDLGVDNVYYRDNMSGEIVENVTFDPRNVRSRFARFDPEFAHLASLSAANVDPLAGLFGALAAEEQRRQRNSQ